MDENLAAERVRSKVCKAWKIEQNKQTNSGIMVKYIENHLNKILVAKDIISGERIWRSLAVEERVLYVAMTKERNRKNGDKCWLINFD